MSGNCVNISVLFGRAGVRNDLLKSRCRTNHFFAMDYETKPRTGSIQMNGAWILKRKSKPFSNSPSAFRRFLNPSGLSFSSRFNFKMVMDGKLSTDIGGFSFSVHLLSCL